MRATHAIYKLLSFLINNYYQLLRTEAISIKHDKHCENKSTPPLVDWYIECVIGMLNEMTLYPI